MPRHPTEYGNLLRDLIAEHKVDCWLVNTGWTGGPYGAGQRMPIKATRALLRPRSTARSSKAEMRIDPHLRLRGAGRGAGRRCQDPRPRDTWADPAGL